MAYMATGTVSELRRRAEVKTRMSDINVLYSLSPEETGQVLNELLPKHIEMEMLNEELHRTQHELKASQARYFDLYNLAPVGYLTLNDKEVVVEANRAATILLGMPLKELRSETLLQFIFPEDQDTYRLYRMRIADTGDTLSCELRMVRADGSRFWGILQVVPAHQGEWWLTLTDITERKRVEAAEQAFELQTRQARQLESLGALAGGLAHDFNNVLAIISGSCSLIKMNYEEAETYIPKIETAADRAAELCRRMLIYAGKAEVIKTEFDMAGLLDEMIRAMKADIVRDAVITFVCPAEALVVTGDAGQVREVIMNLIVNASEALSEPHGATAVSLVRKDITAEQLHEDCFGKSIPAGRYVCMEVSDNGCGMNAETRQRIFEPFYSTKSFGRGLGMSAVLGIVAANDGALQLFSRLGYGTTVRLYLPVPIDTAAAATAIAPLGSRPLQGCSSILLAEDEEQLAQLAEAMLQILGFTVIRAANGKEALELYQHNSADIALVVTDIGMPVMDGYELFSNLKELNPQLPIIISSGFGDAVITSRIPRSAIAGLIGKPYSFEQFRDVVKSAVEVSA